MTTSGESAAINIDGTVIYPLGEHSVYEINTAVRVDFFGTLDKFIHDSLIGVWRYYYSEIYIIYCKLMSCLI